MKFQSTNGDDHSSLSEINIIPLVDIMLVLLIIFMITAPMMKEGIDIDLPEVSAGPVESKTDDFVLSIDDEGRIFINENPNDKYSIVSIEEKLKELFEDKGPKAVYLKADKGVRYGYVIEVMAACQRAGVEKIGIMTMPGDGDEKQP